MSATNAAAADVVERGCGSTLLLASITTPDTAVPLWSVTRPEMSPVCWAYAGAPKNAMARKIALQRWMNPKP